MSWVTLPRRPEPEVMSDADEVEAYASAAAQAYLDRIDDTLVQQVIVLAVENGILSDAAGDTGATSSSAVVKGAGPGVVRRTAVLLDVGTGPGGIPLKIARRCPSLRVVGVDRSLNMIRAARKSAAEQGLAQRAFFLLGDAQRLPFPSAGFDLVISNSLLHHVADPVALFNELARVVKAAGVVLLRDLRRPSRFVFPLHVRWFGRYYSGLMKKLYVNSVRAAYRAPELAELLQKSALAKARVFFHGRTHLGFIRGAQRPG